jgi:4-hydroxy-tetrahydrodipicolinate reductase
LKPTATDAPVRYCEAVIRVGVFGAGGRMGTTVCQAVTDAPGMELVARVDPNHSDLGAGPEALADAGAQVAVDFTIADAARENVRWCAAHGVHAVVGTTGFDDSDLRAFADLFDASAANAVIAPNFAIGAVILMRFAEMAAPYFETAEVIEMHHDKKADAPSGTAMLTAQRIAAASKDWATDPTSKVVAEGARGGTVDGVPVHSVRMRGMIASQEVLLGTTGQSLSLRHDTYDRASFMPGVLLAIQKVSETPGLTVGLDQLLGF